MHKVFVLAAATARKLASTRLNVHRLQYREFIWHHIIIAIIFVEGRSKGNKNCDCQLEVGYN